MGRYVTPRNGRERGEGGRRPDKEPCLSIFGTCFFPFKRWGGHVKGPPWDLSPAISVSARRLPPRAKDFLCPAMVPTCWYPAVAEGGIVQEVVVWPALGTGVKKWISPPFFSGSGRADYRTNFDSESAIWWRGGSPKLRPSAVGRWGRGRGAGGNAVERG